ncbi:MAG: (NiFe) hydrogenase maturation protein HypF [Acidimicrobiales bacterium]|nr:(NiFe) hydrogenase maturation protein HypF [Acidimicrobiales bacterium]
MPESPSVRRRIRVTGTVQGVGFRPFVFRHATRLGLRGWVQNDSAGVLVEVEGAEPAVDELARLMVEEPPPLARVGSVTGANVPLAGDAAFTIVHSNVAGTPTAPVSVDTATCAACLAEVDDPADRRYRYPFTNCTDCGPRYTIVQGVPYDRPATTMAAFTMCAACQAEYDDPADRRFHAQPNACPACGPRLHWTPTAAAPAPDVVLGGVGVVGAAGIPPSSGGVVVGGVGVVGAAGIPPSSGEAVGEAALDAAIAALRAGRIVAVKGIGGFHLAVDATDEAAVAELRRRKARDDKPFAVMVPDLAAARGLCTLSDTAAAELASARRPIVIAPRRALASDGGAAGAGALAAGVAPGLAELGVLLPYSPLHHLLLAGVGRSLVMTSGNLSDEPIAHEDEDARIRLGSLVDGVLGHDRGVHIRCDDSVVRATPRGGTQVLRRSRGFAPEPIPLARAAARPILAVGAELKSTVAVTLGTDVVASHHIGDLEHLATYRSFLQAIDHLCRLYRVVPEVVAHDLHPEYLSSKLAADLDVPAIGVQHHHAHVASCLTEHGRVGPVLGLAFDGLGYGTDGTLWGGELLVADLQGFERVGHLAPVTMPGGVTAIREPWRMGVAWAHHADVPHPFDDPRSGAVLDLATRGQGPTTTSVGRLFDAVAALIGLRRTVTYEAQAAIELEALARRVPRAEAPAFPVDLGRTAAGVLIIDPGPLVAALLARRAAGTAPALLAAGFHEAIGGAAAAAAIELAREHRLRTVALSGGAFQNARLSEIVEAALAAAGLEVLVHRVVPPNDGGISIGQAAVAAAQR